MMQPADLPNPCPRRAQWRVLEHKLNQAAAQSVVDILRPWAHPGQRQQRDALGQIPEIRSSFWYQLLHAFAHSSLPPSARPTSRLERLQPNPQSPIQQAALLEVSVRIQALDTTRRSLHTPWQTLHSWWHKAMQQRNPTLLFHCYRTLATQLNWRADPRAGCYLQSCYALSHLRPDLPLQHALHQTATLLHMRTTPPLHPVPPHLQQTPPQDDCQHARRHFIHARATSRDAHSHRHTFQALIHSAPGGLSGFMDDDISCRIRDLHITQRHKEAMALGFEAMEALQHQPFSLQRIRIALWPTLQALHPPRSAILRMLRPIPIVHYPRTPHIPALDLLQLQRWLGHHLPGAPPAFARPQRRYV